MRRGWGCELEPETERLLRSAVEDGALGTVSGPRVRDELLDLLAEPRRPRRSSACGTSGLRRRCTPALEPDPELVAAAALGSAETGANRALAALAALCSRRPEGAAAFVARLGLGPGTATPCCAQPIRPPDRRTRCASRCGPRPCTRCWRREPPETLALALGLGAPGEPVTRFVTDLRPARLEIGGADLLAAGVPESPAIGDALAETLRRKLDGELSGRDEELAIALELARRTP